MLSGLPKTAPGFSVDRMCAGAMTAACVVAPALAWHVRRGLAGGVEHMGRHPMGEGVDPNPRFLAEKLVDPEALLMGKTAENLHDRFPHLTKERADASRWPARPRRRRHTPRARFSRSRTNGRGADSREGLRAGNSR